MSSSSPLRLTLRQKPHLDFVIGYPGLLPDGNTKQASLEGTVEVRTQNPVHTRWLKVELKKTEVVQTSKGIRKYFELIGSNEQILWSGADKEFADAEKFATLETSDHSFAIPIPPGLPPTIVLDKSKNTGIVYHLVATAMIKVKSKGFFGGSSNHFKPPTIVTQISEVTIEKHELNPSWPIYAWQAETTPLQVKQANLLMQLKRETVIFGGNDAVKLDVEIRSERNAPIKITRIELQVKEHITTREADAVARGVSTDPKKILSQSFDILSLRSPCQNVLYQNESMSHSLSAVFPAHHHHFTVQNAKHLDVKYTMRLRAVVEVPKEAKAKKGEKRVKEEPIKEIILDNVAVIVSPWSKKQAEWWRSKIGHIPRNLQRPVAVPLMTGPPQQPPVDSSVSSPLNSGVTIQATRAADNESSVAGPSARAPNQSTHYANRRLSLASNQQSAVAESSLPLQAQSSSAQNPSAPPMAPEPSNEQKRALAIEQGKRLSSWPPAPKDATQNVPTIAVTASDSNSVEANLAGTGTNRLRNSLPYPGGGYSGQSPDHRQTQSESGHGTMHWQPSREVASLDGHSVAFGKTPPPKAYHMDGAYPMPPSASQSQSLSTMGYANPWSPPASATHRRVFSDGAHRVRRSSQPPPEDLSAVQDERRLSTPLLSSNIPINSRRDNAAQSKDEAALKRRMHVEITQGGFPTRKNTLSTITGSAPSSQQSSPTYETHTVPMPQTEWSSAEEEKERLYNEAVERARRTQERAGHVVADPSYRSVLDRAPTPLSLMRSVSNPIPSRQDHQSMQSMHDLKAPTPVLNNRFSTASTHLGYLNSTPEPGSSQEDLGTMTPRDEPHSKIQDGSDDFDPSTTRRASLQMQRLNEQTANRASSYHPQASYMPPLQAVRPQAQNLLSPLSPSSSWSSSTQLDAQKMAYLKALAAREAYQQRMAGAQPEPLTALEEKQRLQRLFEEEEQRAANRDDSWQSPSKTQPSLPAATSPEDHNILSNKGELIHEEGQDGRQREATPATSVYLTPDTTTGRWQQHNSVTNGSIGHNPYFESPNASSTYLPSDGSSLSQNYRRNPEISEGKQRRQSTYRSEETEAYYDNTISGPPARPPKNRDILRDTYKHFDTPVSPSAEEYERRLLWGRSQNSHHGH